MDAENVINVLDSGVMLIAGMIQPRTGQKILWCQIICQCMDDQWPEHDMLQELSKMVFFGQFIKNNENVAGAEQDGARRERAEREEEGLGEVGTTSFF